MSLWIISPSYTLEWLHTSLLQQINATLTGRMHVCVKVSLEKSNEVTNEEFILQQNTSYSSYSMALSFNIKTGKTRMLIFGAQPWSLTEMFNYLDSISPLPFGPMLLPTIVIELQAKWFSGTINDVHRRIFDIETVTGIRRFLNSFDNDSARLEGWKKLDLIDITRDLNSILSRLAFLKLQSETSAYLVDRMYISVVALKEKLEEDKQSHRSSAQDYTLSKLEFIESWITGIKARCSYLTDRTQAQVQTVCPKFSLSPFL